MIGEILFILCSVVFVQSMDHHGVSSADLHLVASPNQVAFTILGAYSGQTHKGISYKKMYYMSNTFIVSWIEAKTLCKAFDLELATFETIEEIESFIAKVYTLDYFTSHADYRFVLVDGMTLTPGSSTDWYWTNSGIKIPYDIPWQHGEPNNKHNFERCLSFGRPHKGNKLAFNDESCEQAKYAFICQKTMIIRI